MAERLRLPQVTLACADTRTPALALAAMQHCLAQIDFGDAVLFTDAAAVPAPPPGIRTVAVTLDSVQAYSTFMLRGLAPQVRTSHVLVVQWDGYVLDATCWDAAFLAHDYIGALMRDQPPGRSVGNGGFSLRSKRLLDAFVTDEALVATHPEDTCICDRHRERLERVHGIRFAPPELAERFSYERLAPPGPTFGFHGLFNMHRVLGPAELRALVNGLPDAMCRGMDARDLCRALVKRGLAADLGTASLLLARRRRAGVDDWRTKRLALQLWLARRRLG